MRVSIKTLSGVFLAQLCIIAYFWYSSNMAAQQSNSINKPLFDVRLADITEIHIQGDNEQLVHLKKDNENWLIDNYHQAPAANIKVESFLQKLASLKTSWPVATTKETADRFKVGTEKFARKVILIDKEQNGDSILLGTSPSYKKIHARAINDNNIYAVALRLHEASDKPIDWAKTDLLHTPKDSIKKIHLPEYSLERSDNDSFTLSGMSTSESLVDYEIKAIVNQVAHLNFSDIATYDTNAFNNIEPDIQYSLELDTGELIKVHLSQGEETSTEETTYLLTTNQSPLVFKVERAIVDAFAKKQREHLVKNVVDNAPVNAEDMTQAPEVSPVS